MTQKKVIITGANGFIGSHLIDALVSGNYKVIAIVRRSSNIECIENKGVRILRCGLENMSALKDAFKDANWVFHCAGLVKADNQAAFDFGNVKLTENVLEAALANKKSIEKVIVLSSLAAAGPAELDKPINENVSCNPVSLYGKSKLKQEWLVAGYKGQLPLIIVRPPVVFGERDTEVLEFFKLVKMRLVPLAGFRQKQLSIVYVKNLVLALVAMAKSTIHSEVYFVADKEQLSWKQLAESIANCFDKRVGFLYLPHFFIKGLCLGGELIGKFTNNKPALNLNKYDEIIQNAWICSVAKMKDDLNFEPTYSFEDALRNTLEWYQEKKWL